MTQPLVKLSDYTSGKLSVRELLSGSSLVGKQGNPAPKGRVVKPVRGSMNKLESDYARHLDYRIRIKEVVAYYYEAIKFRLADGSWYTPDFLVMLADGLYQVHETKGHMREAANVRLKITSEAFWTFPLFLVKRRGGAFTVTEVGR